MPPPIVPSRHLPSPNPPSTEPGTILLETERLVLRRPLPSDAPLLVAAANHKETAAFMTDRFPSPYTLEDAEDFVYEKLVPKGTPAEYPNTVAIFLKDDPSRLLGTMGAKIGTDINYIMWELGYFLSPEYWGQGYGTEAVGAFTRWCFETWPGLQRMQASTYEFNEASGRVLLKCGFTREGMRRRSAMKNGVMTGEVWYGILREEMLGVPEAM
ncbi:acyl-CoA N-acyltransferase [Emericellopsis atlantica]|uniref:Acyl-CoA N-acyltransferase n=1 Tax=Emericellopsis atlantica TaxID=2614577 RepID=A0A9P7ZT92_9HYPO|nr:acyl-CoA N-acyltransferase [Emericellopsis atlantica]KAG9257889.1 acyl-CoA N-acyltransferase [Emericellopsis atlantica]